MRPLDQSEGRWHEEAETVLAALKEWRVQHPTATFREIEAAVDERLTGMRARLVEDLALASRATEVGGQRPRERPLCPTCAAPLDRRGAHPRTVLTQGGRAVRLQRDDGVCPTCGVGHIGPG